MRMSILNTATTEQMGYDIVSFFRLFSPNESNSKNLYFLSRISNVFLKNDMIIYVYIG